MKMTIDEAKGNLLYAIRWKDRPKDESMELAIEIMHKYEKIVQIIKDHDVDRIPADYWYIDKIRDVIEDRNVN